MAADDGPSIVILGAGINGCSIARELALNGVGAWIVDLNDIAFGATSRSSRLIHGGLRYLEYGDFRLVRESLIERARLRKLAPHLVEPLRLYIPVAGRTGGLVQSALRFVGATRSPLLNSLTRPFQLAGPRGLWTVEAGLSFYDRLASDPATLPHQVHNVNDAGVPRVDSHHYRWLCSYSDAQMRYPERYCIALLDDAQQLAREKNVPFRLFTYSRAIFLDGALRIETSFNEHFDCTPKLVVNATGAWGDWTLRQLDVPAPPLFGGTKGSHFVTHQPALQQAIDGSGVYAEASEGRLIFVLPFSEAVLVGTTDERFEQPPECAVASDSELTYLVDTVNELFPGVNLTRSDVTLTYSGVRPLPRSTGESESAVSRDHSIAVHGHRNLDVLTLVGGKLTTSRAFGEQVADYIFRHLGIDRAATTQTRFVPGGEGFPTDLLARRARWKELASRYELSVDQIRAMETLCGSSVDHILREQQSAGHAADGKRNLSGSALPRTFVRWVIEHEWVARIEDLVERRLMLIYEPALSKQTLAELADLLIEAGRLDATTRDNAIQTAEQRIASVYRRELK